MKTPAVCIIDVGARLPVPDYLIRLAPVSEIISYEPDIEAAQVLQTFLRNSGFKEFAVRPIAVGGREETRTINKTKNPNSSSIYRVSSNFRERYGNAHWNQEDSFEVELTTLDIEASRMLSNARKLHLPIILKLDIQGGEIEALEGAVEILTNKVVAVIVEVDMIGAYDLGPTFFRIGSLLERFGFQLFGFLEIHYRSSFFQESKIKPEGRERFSWGDAIFFKDYLVSQSSTPTVEQLIGLVLAAYTTDYIDFAREVLRKNPILSKLLPKEIYSKLCL